MDSALVLAETWMAKRATAHNKHQDGASMMVQAVALDLERMVARFRHPSTADAGLQHLAKRKVMAKSKTPLVE